MAQVLGGEAFLHRVAAISKVARAEMQKAIRKSAEEHASVARALAPDDPVTHGNDLRSSIHTEVLSDIAVAVIAGTDHAVFQEYGTAKMTANPFMRPSFRLTKKKGQARIKRAFKKAMKAR